MQGMHKNVSRECSAVFNIYKFITFLHIFYSYLYFLKILARNWSVFMHSLCCFIFVYMQIYFFAWINKAFIYSFIHSYQQKRLLLKKLAILIWYLLFGFDILYNDISIALGGLFFLLDGGSGNDVSNKDSENLSNNTVDIFKPIITSA